MNDIMYKDELMSRPAPIWMVKAVEEFIQKTQRKDIWEVVEFSINFWATKHPEDHKQFIQDMKDYRSNRKNKFGSTTDKSQRTLLNLPYEVKYFLDKFMDHRIKEYGEKKFWSKFAKRYPAFAGGDTI